MTVWKTADGDVLDAICLAHYGPRQDAFEAVLEANPGLAARGPVLPGGVNIKLPGLPEAERLATVRLWD